MREKSTPAGPATESGLTGPGPVANDFDGIVGSAVDPVCGVVRALDLVQVAAGEPERPYVARAELANAGFRTDDDAFVPCSGKGWTRRQARDGALGEALERYAAMTWRPQRTISATYDGLGRPALHPRDLVLFADHQYDVVPYQPWLPETELEWVPAQSLVTGNDLWIPLLAAHLGYEPPAGAALFPATSNGFAAGPDPAGATLRALLEVIERDAFLIAWSDRPPAAVTGLAASLDPVAATRSAVFEAAQARPSLCARVRLPEAQALMAELVAAPSEVATMTDHDLLYCDPSAAAAGMRFFREAPHEPWPDAVRPPVAEGNDGLSALVRSLAGVAGDVLAVDVTPLDVAGLGVRVVRGVVP